MQRQHVLGTALGIGLATTPALAERINLASDTSVDVSVGRLTAAVDQAGARVFAVVDFSEGSARIGTKLRPTTVVIFGSPKIGGTVLQSSQTLALHLPLRILFFEDGSGQTWLTYDDPAHVASAHGVPADDPAILRMQAALTRLASIAAGG